jgi:formylglycine-generating enzyme required for sulfatase activity
LCDNCTCSGVNECCDGCVAKPSTSGDMCNDHLPCTHTDTCNDQGACQGMSYSCDSPGACETEAGATCNGDTTCTYPANVGFACNDGEDCTHTDQCQTNKSCQGTSYSCSSPSTCETATGATCNGDNTCSYPANVGYGCNDGEDCTHTDQCQTNKSCLGTPYKCDSAGTCETEADATCNGDNTCTYPANVGFACNDGEDCTHTDECQANKSCTGTSYSCESPGDCETTPGSCNGDSTCTYSSCPQGCDTSSGACWAECDPDIPGFCCEESGYLKPCEHECNSEMDTCWPECTPATDGACCEADGTWTPNEVQQPGTSLYWLRCPLGQYWDVNDCACAGDLETQLWDAALTVCPSGYRLPTKEEFMDLLGRCPPSCPNYCECDSCATSTTCADMFGSTNEWYWASDSYDDSQAWTAWFQIGAISTRDKTSSSWVRCVRSEIAWIPMPGGAFSMGTDDSFDAEKPMHPVTVPSFEILQTEVTINQYEACVNAASCTEPNTSNACAPADRGNWGAAGHENHPVNCVSWWQATDYCAWAGGRLPSESEWEYAASNGSQEDLYPWGDLAATCDYAVMDDPSHTAGCDTGRTWAACSKPNGNSDQDLCDLAGNVGEWVQDTYHGSYDCEANPTAVNCGAPDQAPDDGSAWEDDGSSRVVRGGSFEQTDIVMPATRRGGYYPPTSTVQMHVRGFRCARDVP